MIGLQSHVDLVKSWVQKIRIANGYTTDIGAQVDTERRGGNGDDNSVLVGVFVSVLTPVNSTKQRRDWQNDIVIEARVPVQFLTAEATTLAVMEDMVRCVPTATTDPSDNIGTLEIIETDIGRQPDGTPYIVASVTLRATCYEFISQPA